uniref:Uncharacterized protein n=1 Tax=Psilocybe cubensis TaxID=181762 RepID=A0A8H7Y4E2_PSICU
MSQKTPTIRVFRQPSVLAMDKVPTIRPFRAYDLQYGSNPQHHEFLQSVVFCAGSRFREALIHTLQSSGQRRKRWMQQALQKELNWVLRCIGRAFAIGFNIEIPLVIRCLADTLGSVLTESLPLEIDMAFAEFLACGTRDWAFEKRVGSYNYDWWNRNSAPKPSELLGTATVSEILTYHKAEFYKTFDPEPTTTFDELLKTHIDHKIPEIPPNMSLVHPVQIILDKVGDTCDACDAFQNLAIESIQQLSSIKNHTSIMFSTADNTLDRISRRAIGFFELYEASQRAADTAKGPAPTDSNENPVSKWTWGRQLTTKEVCSLGDGKKASHSGYAESLRDGKLRSRSVDKPIHSPHTSDVFESVSSVAADNHLSNEAIKHPQYFEDGTDSGTIASMIEKAATSYESDSDASDTGDADTAPSQATQSVAELLAHVEYISSDSDDLDGSDDSMHGEDGGKGTDTGKKRQNIDTSANSGAVRRTKPRGEDGQSVKDQDAPHTTAYFTKNFFSCQLDEDLFEMDADEDEDADEDGDSEGRAME